MCGGENSRCFFILGSQCVSLSFAQNWKQQISPQTKTHMRGWRKEKTDEGGMGWKEMEEKQADTCFPTQWSLTSSHVMPEALF